MIEMVWQLPLDIFCGRRPQNEWPRCITCNRHWNPGEKNHAPVKRQKTGLVFAKANRMVHKYTAPTLPPGGVWHDF